MTPAASTSIVVIDVEPQRAQRSVPNLSALRRNRQRPLAARCAVLKKQQGQGVGQYGRMMRPRESEISAAQNTSGVSAA